MARSEDSEVKSSEADSARIVVDARMEGCELVAVAGGTAYVFSQRSPDKSTPNEDSALVVSTSPTQGFLAVADGVGGQPGGANASKLIVESIAEGLRGCAKEGGSEVRARVLDAIENANRDILSEGVGSATTLAAVEITGNTIRPYHIGDSEVLVVGQRGRIKLQTVAHSPVGYAVEAGVIDAEDAMHHAERHLVSNVVGSDEMRIEVGSPLTLSSRDTVLVASDGLLDNLHTGEIVDRIRCGPLDKAAESLVSLAQTRMGSERGNEQPRKPDDLTLIVYRRDPKS